MPMIRNRPFDNFEEIIRRGRPDLGFLVCFSFSKKDPISKLEVRWLVRRKHSLLETMVKLKMRLTGGV